MEKLNKILEIIIGNEDFTEIKSSKIRDIINGDIFKKRFIQKQFGLFIFIIILTVFSISNRYYCESQISQQVQLKKEFQDAKYESLTVSAQLTTLGRRSYVLNYIENKGMNLKESLVAPIVIIPPGEEKDVVLNDTINKKLNTQNDTLSQIAVD